MNERISGLSKRASPLSSLLAKLWIDVCVTLALLGLSFPILEMDHLMEPPSVYCSIPDRRWTFSCTGLPPPHPMHTRILMNLNNCRGSKTLKEFAIVTIIDLGTNHSLQAGVLQSSLRARLPFVLFTEADCRASGMKDIITGTHSFISFSLSQLFTQHLLSTGPGDTTMSQKPFWS